MWSCWHAIHHVCSVGSVIVTGHDKSHVRARMMMSYTVKLMVTYDMVMMQGHHWGFRYPDGACSV